jgi:hypothetical protein
MDVQELLDEVSRAAAALGWTVTGEPGVGLDASMPSEASLGFVPVITVAIVEALSPSDFEPASFQVLLADDEGKSDGFVRRQVLIDSTFGLPTVHDLMWLTVGETTVRLTAAARSTQVSIAAELVRNIVELIGEGDAA